VNCWGSQTSGAGGHRNNAMPFCFVRSPARASTHRPVHHEDTKVTKTIMFVVSFVSFVFFVTS
jgi:hypothetical protein